MSCNILLIFSAGYIREIIDNYTLYHYNHEEIVVNSTIVNGTEVNTTMVNSTLVNGTLVNETIVTTMIVNGTIVNTTIVTTTLVDTSWNVMMLENISFWIGLNLTRDQCWMWTDEQYFIFSSWAKGKFLKDKLISRMHFRRRQTARSVIEIQTLTFSLRN